MTKGYVAKTLRFYSEEITNEEMQILKEIAKRYTSAKNYFYSRYAVGGIKSVWSNAKNKIIRAVYQHPKLTEKEKHFICYVLK